MLNQCLPIWMHILRLFSNWVLRFCLDKHCLLPTRNGHLHLHPILLPILKLEKLSIIAIFSKILFLILFVRPNIFSFSHASVFRLLFIKKRWGKYAVLLSLPNEVLFDVFKFLNRRQLTNLERVCPRFHRIISDHIGETPFLRLDIGFWFDARFFFPHNQFI